ncbi:hypothetical protein HK104_008599 [Borealophlyctis nickersoniae]|nr:hypothetical protein HK104_008599 [Borealophlyctis nickersoniae]
MFDSLQAAIHQTLERIRSRDGEGRTAELNAAVDELIRPALDKYPRQSSSELLGCAFKGFIIENVRLKRGVHVIQEGQQEDVQTFNRMFDMLDVAGRCVHNELVDVFTIDGIEKLFDFLDARRGTVKEGLEPSRGKSLVLLRICGEILRRLSKSKNMELCGRVLLFMASVYSLSERSGVNLRGEFNVENVTHYEGEGEADTAMDVDGDETAKTERDDRSFYKTFWGLQRFISNPPLLCDPNNFQEFRNGFEVVLGKFHSINLEQNKKQSLDRKRKHRTDEHFGTRKNDFFPKFLTSFDMFDWELKDPMFRRQILTQFAIILQYLSSLTEAEKAKEAKYFSDRADDKKVTMNRQVIQMYTLTAEQAKWVADVRPKITSLVENTSPNGRAFKNIISTVITHEKNWIHWKNRNCDPFEKPKFVGDAVMKPKIEFSEGVRNRDFMGTRQLTSVWKEAEGVDDFLRKRRKVAPLDEFIQPLDEQIQDDCKTVVPEIEPEYSIMNDERFIWRGYRIAIQNHLSMFTDKGRDKTANASVDPLFPGRFLLSEWRNLRPRPVKTAPPPASPNGLKRPKDDEEEEGTKKKVKLEASTNGAGSSRASALPSTPDTNQEGPVTPPAVAPTALGPVEVGK